MMTPLDAEFLDGMIQVCEMKKEAALAYMQMADASSDPQVMDMARDIISMSDGTGAMYKEKRGVVDSSDLTREANTGAVEVTASY